MQQSLSFSSSRPLVIGMIHFGPLIGRPEAPSIQAIEKKASSDLRTLIRGGVDAVMFENMYDQPHTERLDTGRIREFDTLLRRLTPKLRLPFGLSVLWNDYPTAMRLAKKYGASWIRVPVFVDSVKTNYGLFRAQARNVIAVRKKLGAQRISIMADVQVKHATMMRPRPIALSALDTVRAGADMVIVTGKWTGDPPTVKDVRALRRVVGQTPIIIGSGMTSRNIHRYRRLVDGLIVGTDLKRGGASPAYAMRAPWQRPLARTRVVRMMQAVKSRH